MDPITIAILLVAVFVLSQVLLPKPKVENARPAGLGDFRFPTATQGRVVPLVWGTVKIEGPNVVWYGDLEQQAITKSIKSGFFSKKRFVAGFKYYVGIQFALCRGAINGTGDGVKRIWIGDREVFNGSVSDGTISINTPDLLGGDDLGAGGVVGTLRVHPGTATQAVNSYLTGFQSISGATPRYKRTVYCVFEHGYIGNSTSIDPWSFEVRRIPNGLGLGTATVNSGNDANPMNVVYELITDPIYGFGHPAADVDLTAFTNAANTLRTEGNGFSGTLDSPKEADELMRELQRQIDGFVFRDHRTGKWTVKLNRADYDINTVPQLTNPKDVRDFSRGSWEDTTNEVHVQFFNRVNNYTEDFALAQDMANAMIQGGGSVSTGVIHPATSNFMGVKDATLANQLAWRGLRTLSYPLAKATFVVDRSFWDTTPGDVIAWTDTARGFVKLPMRVFKADYGDLEDNAIKLDCVQDVFYFGAGSYGSPPGSNWTPPADSLSPFASNRQLAIEAPRGIVTRDPDYTGTPTSKVMVSARRGSVEVSYLVRHRSASGAPAGAFSDGGEVYSFALIGSLKNSLAAGSGVPLASITLTASPDAQATLEAAFTDNPDLTDQGTNLTNLVMVGNEFMLVGNASTSGADVVLGNVYRGVLDSVQEAHLANDLVWLVFRGVSVTDVAFDPTYNVDIKLLPRSRTSVVAEGSATTISLTMDRRIQRPLAPSRLLLNSSLFPATVDIDAVSAGSPEAAAFTADFIRRDYRQTNEIPPLTTDAASLAGDFPSANTHTVEIQVRNDPAGANTLLFTETGIAVATKNILRIKILRFTNGVIPTTLRLALAARHNDGASTGLASRYSLTWDFSATCDLTGRFNFGARAASAASNVYTATVAGAYNFTLSSSFTTGNVEYRINGGAWTTVISAGNTTGSVVGVLVSDTIEVRHTSTDVNALKQLDMDAPGAGTDAYFIPYT